VHLVGFYYKNILREIGFLSDSCARTLNLASLTLFSLYFDYVLHADGETQTRALFN